MRSTTRSLQIVAGLIAASIFLPGVARAQESGRREPAALEESAGTLSQTPDGWPKAIRLLREAASRRGPGEMQGVKDLVLAGLLSEYAGQHEQARLHFTDAGNRALNMGDVEDAAHAFIYAAFVAKAQDDIPGAGEFVERARTLSYSPLLPNAERDQINRWVGSPVQVAARQH